MTEYEILVSRGTGWKIVGARKEAYNGSKMTILTLEQL